MAKTKKKEDPTTEVIVTMYLTYPGKVAPGQEDLQTIADTIANEIENDGLDLSLGDGERALLHSVTVAKLASAHNKDLIDAMELAIGWIDSHRGFETNKESQNTQWIMDTCKAAVKTEKGGKNNGKR